MKKLLAGILATATCFACVSATACGGDKGNGLEDAAKKLSDLYKAETLTSGADYDVVNEVVVDDVTYTVTWSVDVTSGVAVVVGTSKTTIDVDQDATASIPYVLTATIADDKGKTQTVTFDGEVPEMVFTALKSAPAALPTTAKLYMKDASTNKEYYFNGKLNGSSLGFTQKRSEAVDITFEKPYETTQYYFTFKDASGKKQYIGVKSKFIDGEWKSVLCFTDTITEYDQISRSGEFIWAFDANLKIATTIVTDVKSGTDESATGGRTATFYACANADFTSVEAKELMNGETESGAVILQIGTIGKKA